MCQGSSPILQLLDSTVVHRLVPIMRQPEDLNNSWVLHVYSVAVAEIDGSRFENKLN